MIVPVMAISNLVLTRQIYSKETNGAHAHYREPVPLSMYKLSDETWRHNGLRKTRKELHKHVFWS